MLQWYAGKKLWRKSKNAPNYTLAPKIPIVKKHSKQINLGEISPYRFLNQLLKRNHAKDIKNKTNMKMALDNKKVAVMRLSAVWITCYSFITI